MFCTGACRASMQSSVQSASVVHTFAPDVELSSSFLEHERVETQVRSRNSEFTDEFVISSPSASASIHCYLWGSLFANVLGSQGGKIAGLSTVGFLSGAGSFSVCAVSFGFSQLVCTSALPLNPSMAPFIRQISPVLQSSRERQPAFPERRQ